MSQRVQEINTQAEQAAIKLNRGKSRTTNTLLQTISVILMKHFEAAT